MAVAIRLGFETNDITTYFYTFVENLQVANIVMQFLHCKV